MFDRLELHSEHSWKWKKPTPPKIPLKGTVQKETSSPNHQFSGNMLVFRRVYPVLTFSHVQKQAPSKTKSVFFHESIATIYRMQNGTACPKKGGQWEGLAIYLPGFVCTANSGSSPHVYIPSKIIQIHGHVSIRFIFNHYVQKKHLNSTISCFRFQKNYTTPRGGCNLQGRYKRFSEHGLLSYRLLRWSNSTLCQSSGGCQAPGAFQGQGARLHGLKIPHVRLVWKTHGVVVGWWYPKVAPNQNKFKCTYRYCTYD